MVQSASQFLPNMHSAGPAMGATGAWDLGYQGEGMSVAILDTGLSYENPSFIQEPQDQSRVAYTKEDIATILEANNLHAEALSEETSLDTVYYSGKVPFGFNYADGLANFGTDDDTAWATAPTWLALWRAICRRRSRSSSTWRPWALPRRHSWSS